MQPNILETMKNVKNVQEFKRITSDVLHLLYDLTNDDKMGQAARLLARQPNKRRDLEIEILICFWLLEKKNPLIGSKARVVRFEEGRLVDQGIEEEYRPIVAMTIGKQAAAFESFLRDRYSVVPGVLVKSFKRHYLKHKQFYEAVDDIKISSFLSGIEYLTEGRLPLPKEWNVNVNIASAAASLHKNSKIRNADQRKRKKAFDNLLQSAAYPPNYKPSQIFQNFNDALMAVLNFYVLRATS